MKNELIKNLIVLLMVTVLCSVFLLSCDVFDDKNSNAFKVYDIIPANGATATSQSVTISITFSNDIDKTTATNATILLTDDKGKSVAGTVSSYGIAVSFTPTAKLDKLTTYTVTIKTQLKDTHGRSLSSDYTSSFTTGDDSA